MGCINTRQWQIWLSEEMRYTVAVFVWDSLSRPSSLLSKKIYVFWYCSYSFAGWKQSCRQGLWHCKVRQQKLWCIDIVYDNCHIHGTVVEIKVYICACEGVHFADILDLFSQDISFGIGHWLWEKSHCWAFAQGSLQWLFINRRGAF